MPSAIRATIVEHSGRYTVIGDGSEREHVISVAVVSRQVQRAKGNWRTTRQTLVDAGAASLHTARGVAARIASDVEVRSPIDHGNLGTFDQDDEEGMAAMRQRFTSSTLSRRKITHVVGDATGRAVCAEVAA